MIFLVRPVDKQVDAPIDQTITENRLFEEGESRNVRNIAEKAHAIGIGRFSPE